MRDSDDLSSVAYYDEVASQYPDLLKSRESYLRSVENLIVENNKSVNRYLDIGCGDGQRSLKIINRLNPQQSALIDSSAEMLKGFSSEGHDVDVHVTSFLDYESDEKFDLITCLWNVLGHVGDMSQRDHAVAKMTSLLSPGGVLAIDVNNRYNIVHYGVMSFVRNYLFDMFRRSDRGNFNLPSNGQCSKVFIYNPLEFDALLSKYLKINKRFYVNYNDGSLAKNYFGGQLLYLSRSCH